MDEWFCRMGGQDYGPMPFQQLFQAASAGQLPADAMVRFGAQDWIPITAMPQLAGFFQGAKPAAVPVVQASPPVAVPVATPIATPVATPIATPVTGKAVKVAGQARPATPVAAVPRGAVPAGVAVGRPVAPVQAVGVRTSAVSVVPAPPGSHSSPGHFEKKKNSLTMVYLLGGSVAGLLLVGLVVFLNSGSSKKTSADAADKTGESVEAMIADLPNNGEVQPPASPVSAAVEAPPTSGHSAELALFTKPQKWRDPRSVKSLSSKALKLEIVHAWLAADASGKQVATSAAVPATTTPAMTTAAKTSSEPGPSFDPFAEGNAKPAAEQPTAPMPAEPPATPPATSAEPKYVVVQLRISNPSQERLTYNSWNGPAKDNLAMLTAEKTEWVSLAPAEGSSGLPRRTGSIALAPGQQVVDTLVFEAPQTNYSTLHLLLPQTALPALGPGYLGWELHRDYLASAPSEIGDQPVFGQTPGAMPPAGTMPAPGGKFDPVMGSLLNRSPDRDFRPNMPASDPAASAAGTNSDAPGMKPAAEGAKPAGEQPAMPAAESKPGEPPSIKELDKQFREFEKTQQDKEKMDQEGGEKEKMDKPAEPAPEKPADPK